MNHKKGTILTVGISEARKDQYIIIAYLEEKCRFVSFVANNFYKEDRYLLDVGAKSKIVYQEIDNENIQLTGDIVLSEYLEKQEFLAFLERKKTNFSSFKRNINYIYRIVRVKAIDSISVSSENSNVKCKICFFADGSKDNIIVKDYRWIKYWKHILNLNDEKIMEDRKNYYKTFFNNRDTYILLFRFKNNSSQSRFKDKEDPYWISGIYYK